MASTTSVLEQEHGTRSPRKEHGILLSSLTDLHFSSEKHCCNYGYTYIFLLNSSSLGSPKSTLYKVEVILPKKLIGYSGY